MSNHFDHSEIVHEGWLTKSPPTTRIWRARWRKRWFVLKQGGEIPGQYIICYFTDRNCRKLKGQIDLDQCEQVDAGLRFESRKTKYQHLFDLRTPKRTYYLAADTEDDMNRWVDAICHICNLKTFPPPSAASELRPIGPLGPPGEDFFGRGGGGMIPESPPISPTSTVSGPYIPISECISGKPLSSPDGLSDFLALQHGLSLRTRFQYGGPQFEPPPGHETTAAPPTFAPVPARDLRLKYNAGHRPGNLDLRRISAALQGHQEGSSYRAAHLTQPDLSPPPLASPATDGESVFTDDDDDTSSVVTSSSIPPPPPAQPPHPAGVYSIHNTMTHLPQVGGPISTSLPHSGTGTTVTSSPIAPSGVTSSIAPSGVTSSIATSGVTSSIATSGGAPGKPSVNWETFPLPHVSRPVEPNLEGDVPKLAPNSRFSPSATAEPPQPPLLAPPRPPKPNHLVTTPTAMSGCQCAVPGSCDSCVAPTSGGAVSTGVPTFGAAPGSGNLTIPTGGPNLGTSGNLTPSGVPTCAPGPTAGTPVGSSGGPVSSQGPIESPSSTSGRMDQGTGDDGMSQEVSRSQMSADAKKSASCCLGNGSSGYRRTPGGGRGNVSGDIFRYDFDTPPACPSPPPLYSNLPSPSSLSTPPLVYRELKPGRKHSDSTNSNEASPVWGGYGPSPPGVLGMGPVGYGPSPTGQPSLGPAGGPPNIDRKLKPAVLLPTSMKKYEPQVDSPTLKLAAPPVGGGFARRRNKTRAAPSPVPPPAPSSSSSYVQRRHSTSDDDVRIMYSEDQVYICNNTKFHTMGYSRARGGLPPGGGGGFDKIQYLDLDFLDPTSSSSTPAQVSNKPGVGVEGSPGRPLHDSRSDLLGTTYKTIDFLKTEAFNRTRQQRQVELVHKQTAQVT